MDAASPLDRASGLLSRARYWTGHTLSEAGGLAWGLGRAGWQAAAGDPEAALLGVGKLIRFNQMARERLATYARADRLIKAHPERLKDYRPEPPAPEAYIGFIGYSRSGHSLIASLLDAHPDVTLSHEMHAFKHFEAGATPEEVYTAIQLNAVFFAHFGRSYFGYDYTVEGSHQGGRSAVRLIGDKKANGTARMLTGTPDLLSATETKLGVPVHLIHVIRNPYDNIATRARRTSTSLAYASRGYFTNAETIQRIDRERPEQIHHVFLDDLIRDPKPTLTTLFDRLGLGADAAFVDACAEVVFNEPSKTSKQTAWAPETKARIDREIKRFPWFERFLDNPDAA